MYLLDTDHMSVIQHGGAEALRLEMRLGMVPEADVVTCIVVYEERMRGWLAKAARAQPGNVWIEIYQSLNKNLTSYCALTIMPFDAAAALHFDAPQAAKLGVIGTQDLKIAAIALANNATVLTRNTRHFGKVPGLLFADWTI